MLNGNNRGGLTRGDINKQSDPFASSENGAIDETFDAPASAFHRLAAEQQQDNFAPMQARPDTQPMRRPLISGVQQNATDADETAQMRLAWDAWHKRVAQAIYQRFSTLSNMAFKNAPPLCAQVAYAVTRDGQITNVHFIQKSPNLMFNSLILGVLSSINGDASILTFPQGSRRVSVDKSGTFTQNYGIEGFKYTTGDQETIQMHRK